MTNTLPPRLNTSLTIVLKIVFSKIESKFIYVNFFLILEMTRESMVSSYNTEEALGDKPLELVRPTNNVHEHNNTIHHQILEVTFTF